MLITVQTNTLRMLIRYQRDNKEKPSLAEQFLPSFYERQGVEKTSRNPGTVEKRIANSDGRTDGLTNGLKVRPI